GRHGALDVGVGPAPFAADERGDERVGGLGRAGGLGGHLESLRSVKVMAEVRTVGSRVPLAVADCAIYQGVRADDGIRTRDPHLGNIPTEFVGVDRTLPGLIGTVGYPWIPVR